MDDIDPIVAQIVVNQQQETGRIIPPSIVTIMDKMYKAGYRKGYNTGHSDGVKALEAAMMRRVSSL